MFFLDMSNKFSDVWLWAKLVNTSHDPCHTRFPVPHKLDPCTEHSSTRVIGDKEVLKFVHDLYEGWYQSYRAFHSDNRGIQDFYPLGENEALTRDIRTAVTRASTPQTSLFLSNHYSESICPPRSTILVMDRNIIMTNGKPVGLLFRVHGGSWVLRPHTYGFFLSFFSFDLTANRRTVSTLIYRCELSCLAPRKDTRQPLVRLEVFKGGVNSKGRKRTNSLIFYTLDLSSGSIFDLRSRMQAERAKPQIYRALTA
ncbi:hypothetical protein BDY19DRAFT_595675 [Irpex rosettiformis]|uniref:Uncharacterized protein n=1 Tax=Irpex rosettiformis TaxID=378272 RepID=A0ACB8UDJ5_9APHY|nr:hypothetical protein BDY19DRAFT_595675 [Irpex rosettiformis]